MSTKSPTRQSQRRNKQSVKESKRGKTRRTTSSPEQSYEPVIKNEVNRLDYIQAAGIALLSFAIYAATACRTIYTGDSSELAAAAAVFGVPHPPGYPLYTLLTALAVNLVPVSEKAFAANLMSSVYGACAVGLAFLFFRRLDISKAGCWFGAIVLASGRTFWEQSLMAEVYSFDMLLFFIVLHATLLVVQRSTQTIYFLTGLFIGLWLGHRFLNVIYLPALILIVWAVKGSRSIHFHRGALIAGLALAALPFTYLPISSAFDPPIDIGDPERWNQFWTVVTGTPYRRHFMSGAATLAFGRLVRFFLELPVETGLACLLCVYGTWILWVRNDPRRKLTIGLLTLAACNLLFAMCYNILDIQVYFLPSYVVIIIVGSLGADRILTRIRAWHHPLLRWTVEVMLLIGALLGLALNVQENNLKNNFYVRHMAEDILASADPNALLFVHGDTIVHSLWYLQAVEKRAPGVILISPGHIHPWYLDILEERYPSKAWPEYSPFRNQNEHACLILKNLEPTHTVYFSSSLNPSEILRAGGDANRWREYHIVQKGLLKELRNKNRPFNPSKYGLYNLKFFREAINRLGPVMSQVDVETKAIYLDYAMALSHTATLLQQSGKNDLALECYMNVLRFHPDRYEREMREAYRTIGWHMSPIQLGNHARRAIEAIQRNLDQGRR